MPASMECVSSAGWASAGMYGFSLARSPAAEGYQRRCSSSTPSPTFCKKSFSGQTHNEVALMSRFDLELLPTEAVFVGVDIVKKRPLQTLGNTYNKSEGFLSNISAVPMRVSLGSDHAVCTESWLEPASAVLARHSSFETVSMQSNSSQLGESLQSQLVQEARHEEQVPRSERGSTQHACAKPLSIPGAAVAMSTPELDLSFSVAPSQGRSHLRRVARVYRDMNLMCEQN